jgi:hypothetical protein
VNAAGRKQGPYHKDRFDAIMLVGQLRVEYPSDDVIWLWARRITRRLFDTLDD